MHTSAGQHLCVGVVLTERSQDTGGRRITCCSPYNWHAGWRVRGAPWRTTCCSLPTMTNDYMPLTCCWRLRAIAASPHGKVGMLMGGWKSRTVRAFVKVIHSYLRKSESDAAVVIPISIDKKLKAFSAGLSGCSARCAQTKGPLKVIKINTSEFLVPQKTQWGCWYEPYWKNRWASLLPLLNNNRH